MVNGPRRGAGASSAALALKNTLFTLVVPGTVAVAIPLLLSRGQAPATGPRAALACEFFSLGIAIYAWCLWDFAAFGRGTPAPIDAPRRLVVRGLYRYTRNPMYVGVLSAVLGWIYVAARVVHSLVQALANRVTLRFAVFVFSSLVLLALIVQAALAVF